MRQVPFGVEIETVNRSREKLARAIAQAIGGTANYEGGGYDKWVAVGPDGRKWTCMSDASINGSNYTGEVVTPILQCDVDDEGRPLGGADIDLYQQVIRALRAEGARVNKSCGLHVHVDARSVINPDLVARVGEDAAQTQGLINLANIVYQQEDLVTAALAVQADRLRWCRPMPDDLIGRIKRARPGSMDALASAWYDQAGTGLGRGQGRGYDPSYIRREHYHHTRYHGLNLHSVWYRGTVEFRWFEATIHAGIVKAYIQFAVALALYAGRKKATRPVKKPYAPEHGKYDFRTFLLRLGFIGDEFKVARQHLLANLRGDIAWRNSAA